MFAELGSYFDLDYPNVLPGGAWALFSALSQGEVEQEDNIIRLRQVRKTPQPSVPASVAQSVSTGERKVVMSGGRFARYVSTGHLVYFQDYRLWGVGFDRDRVEVTSDPVPLVEAVRSGLGGEMFHQAAFAIADDGSLAFVSGPRSGQRTLALVDRETGAVEELSVSPADYHYPRIAPDGRRYAVVVREPDSRALWIHEPPA